MLELATIQLRAGSTGEWEFSNPVLQPGEPGVDLTLGKLKLGDGETDWDTLPFVGGSNNLLQNGQILGTLSIPSALTTDSTTKTNLRAAAGLSSSDSPTFTKITLTSGIGAFGTACDAIFGTSFYGLASQSSTARKVVIDGPSKIMGISNDSVLAFWNSSETYGPPDLAFSAINSTTVGLGNGTVGDFSGGLKLTTLSIVSGGYLKIGVEGGTNYGGVIYGDGAGCSFSGAYEDKYKFFGNITATGTIKTTAVVSDTTIGFCVGGDGNAKMFLGGYYVSLGKTHELFWSDGDYATSGNLTGFGFVEDGVLQLINSSGDYRDLKLRNLTASGTITLSDPSGYSYIRTAENLVLAAGYPSSTRYIYYDAAKHYFRNIAGTALATIDADGVSATNLTASGTITGKSFIEGVNATLVPVVSSATLSLSGGSVIVAQLTADTLCAFTMPTAGAGLSFVLQLRQAAGGGGTAAFTGVVWPNGISPDITPDGGSMDILSFVAGPNAAMDGYVWYGSIVPGFTPPA